MQWVLALTLVCAVEMRDRQATSVSSTGKVSLRVENVPHPTPPKDHRDPKSTGQHLKHTKDILDIQHATQKEEEEPTTTTTTTTPKTAGPLWNGHDEVMKSWSEPRDNQIIKVDEDGPPPDPVEDPEKAGRERAAVFALKKHANKLYSAGWSGKIMAWDVTPGQTPVFLGEMDHHADVKALAVHPDGSIVYSAGALGWIKRWRTIDLQDGSLYKLIDTDHDVMMRHGDVRVETLTIDPNGTKLLSGASDGTVKEWDISTPEEVPPMLRTFAYSSSSFENVAVLSVSYNTDGTALYAANENGQIVQFDPLTGAQLNSLDTQLERRKAAAAGPGYVADPIEAIGVGFDGTLFSGGWDGYVRGYVQKEGGWHEVIDSRPATVTSSMCSAPLSKWILTGGNDGKVTVWHWSLNETIQAEKKVSYDRGEIEGDEANKAGRSLSKLVTLHQGSQVQALIMSKDEKHIFAGSFDGRIIHWDPTSWHPVSSMSHYSTEVMTFDPEKKEWTVVTSGTPPPVKTEQPVKSTGPSPPVKAEQPPKSQTG